MGGHTTGVFVSTGRRLGQCCKGREGIRLGSGCTILLNVADDVEMTGL